MWVFIFLLSLVVYPMAVYCLVLRQRFNELNAKVDAMRDAREGERQALANLVGEYARLDSRQVTSDALFRRIDVFIRTKWDLDPTAGPMALYQKEIDNLKGLQP